MATFRYGDAFFSSTRTWTFILGIPGIWPVGSVLGSFGIISLSSVPVLGLLLGISLFRGDVFSPPPPPGGGLGGKAFEIH